MSKTSFKIIRIGLALVFLAGSLTVFFAPQEIKELLEASFILQILPLPISTFLVIIGVNDLLVAGLLILNKYQKYVLVWSMIWLIATMVVTGEPLHILEHLGFFSMALALWVEVVSN